MLRCADVRQHRDAAVPEGRTQRGGGGGDVFQRGRGDGVPESRDGRRTSRGLDDQRAERNATHQPSHHQGSRLLLPR